MESDPHGTGRLPGLVAWVAAGSTRPGVGSTGTGAATARWYFEDQPPWHSPREDVCPKNSSRTNLGFIPADLPFDFAGSVDDSVFDLVARTSQHCLK